MEVEESGTYSIKLRRWPEETKLALNASAPIRPALEGTSVSASKPGKALSIKKARLTVQDYDETIAVDPKQEYVEFTVTLTKGATSLQTWFYLDTQETLGAYFVSVEKL